VKPAFAVVAGLFLTIVVLGVIQNEGYGIKVLATPPPNCTQTPLPANVITPTPAVTDNQNNDSTSLQHSDGIKVYGEDYPRELKGINWGEIVIGKTSYKHISVTNLGDQPVTLELSVKNWTPGVDGTITWSYNGKNVPAGTAVSITLALTIYGASSDTFGNSIIITSKNTRN
jgi:hypothetical protein